MLLGSRYDKEKVYHIQGGMDFSNVASTVIQKTYQDDALVRKMIAEQKDMKVPCELIPFCPECGAPLEINKRNAEKGMVESAEFFCTKKHAMMHFLEEHKDDKVLF